MPVDQRLLVAALLLAACKDVWQPGPGQGAIQGRVVDVSGHPVEGATILAEEAGAWLELTASGPDGSFLTPALAGNRWLRAEASGYLPRTRAATPAEPVVLRLSADDGVTARLLFTGSAMFGRGYLEPGADGAPPLVRPGSEWPDLMRAIEGVAPLLADADLTGVALETPLSLSDATAPGKESAWSSHPLVAPVLRAAGVDVVGQATDHAYDLLEPGIAQTRASLLAAGVQGPGAGADEEHAWLPAFLDVGVARVALLGCTTIDGDDAEVSYVADDALGKGGAARCTAEAVATAVGEAAGLADLVVLWLHAGYQLDPEPSTTARELAEVAVDHGAGLVLGTHPLVQGGLAAQDGATIAWSLGPLASDFGLWDTFPSGALEVHIGLEGEIKRAFLEPLLLEELLPRGLAGWPRQKIAREVAARSEAPVALDDGAVEIDLAGLAEVEERTIELASGGTGWSHPVDLRDGWLVEIAGAEAWRSGRDLLRVGDFEDIDVDRDLAEGSLWSLDSDWERVTAEAAHAGDFGLRLERTGTHADALWTSPSHRLPIAAGATLTVAGWARGDGEARVQFSWYTGTSGASFAHQVFELPLSADWEPFAFDLAAPEGAVAMTPYFQLMPPERGRVSLDLDELRVVAWEEGHGAPSAACDSLAVQGAASAVLQRVVMPLQSP